MRLIIELLASDDLWWYKLSADGNGLFVESYLVVRYRVSWKKGNSVLAPLETRYFH